VTLIAAFWTFRRTSGWFLEEIRDGRNCYRPGTCFEKTRGRRYQSP